MKKMGPLCVDTSCRYFL